MLKVTTRRFASAAVLALVAATFAQADSVGPSCAKKPGGNTEGDSGHCRGDVYMLTLTSFDSATNTYVVTLQDNTSGFTGEILPGYVQAVALQLNISGGGTVSGQEVALVSAPGGTSDWSSVKAGDTNSKGCDGKGNFFCVELVSSDQGANAPDRTGNSNPYTWIFDVTLPSGETLDENSFGDDIKVVDFIADKNNKFDGVRSGTPITLEPTPEPLSALLYTTGLLAILLVVRRVQA